MCWRGLHRVVPYPGPLPATAGGGAPRCDMVPQGTEAPKEGGKHKAEDFPEELLLGSQAAFDLDDEVIRQAHVVEGLVQGVDIALGVAWLLLMAFFRMQTPAVDGLSVLFDVSR